MNSNKVLIFDLDGTIIDSKELMIEAFEESFYLSGGVGNIPKKEFLSLNGLPFKQIIEKLSLPKLMIDNFPSISRKKIDRLKLFPGIESTISFFHKKNLKIGILTGKDRLRTMEILNFFNLSRYFTHVFTSCDTQVHKPDPKIIDEVALVFNSTPSSIIMVGDSKNDMLAASRAGAFAIGCTWGVANHGELLESGADVYVTNAEELQSELTKLVYPNY